MAVITLKLRQSKRVKAKEREAFDLLLLFGMLISVVA